MIRGRGLVLLLFVLAACDAPASEHPPAGSAEPAREPPVTEPDDAAPQREPNANQPTPALDVPEQAVPKSELSKPEAAASEPAQVTEPRGACCRTCKAGKACGDSCIARTSTCTKPAGCACDGGL